MEAGGRDKTSASSEKADTEKLKEAAEKLSGAATLLAGAKDSQAKSLGEEVTDVLVRVRAARERLLARTAGPG